MRRTLPQHWLAHRRRRTPTRRHGHRAMQRGRSTSRTCVVANCAKGRETRAGYCAEHARLAQSGGAGGASWVADEETDVCVTTLTMHTAAHNPTLIHPPHAFVRRCSDSSYSAGSQQHDRSLRSYTSSSFTPPTLPRAPLPKTTYDNRARRLMLSQQVRYLHYVDQAVDV